MRKIEYIFLLFFISAVAFAQNKSAYTYQPFITDGACVWLSRYEPMGGTPNDIRLVISSEDSVYQSNIYKKVYKYLFCNTTEEEKECIGIIREENKRVYYQGKQSITPLEDSEKLLYDFNLKVDDKISYTYNNAETYRVIKIDTLQIEGIWRRKYTFINVRFPDQSWSDYWIEGIGSRYFYGLTDPMADIPTATIPILRCVLHGQNILYKASSLETNCLCENAPQHIVKIKNNDSIKFSVKEKMLFIQLGKGKANMLGIYTSDGKQLIKRKITEMTDEICQDLKNIPLGSYIFVLSYDKEQETGKFILRE